MKTVREASRRAEEENRLNKHFRNDKTHLQMRQVTFDGFSLHNELFLGGFLSLLAFLDERKHSVRKVDPDFPWNILIKLSSVLWFIERTNKHIKAIKGYRHHMAPSLHCILLPPSSGHKQQRRLPQRDKQNQNRKQQQIHHNSRSFLCTLSRCLQFFFLFLIP